MIGNIILDSFFLIQKNIFDKVHFPHIFQIFLYIFEVLFTHVQKLTTFKITKIKQVKRHLIYIAFQSLNDN